MAEALVSGLLKQGLAAPEQVRVTDVLAERCRYCESKYGVSAFSDNAAAVRHADVVVLAVKPQVMKSLLADIRPALTAQPLFLSIAAGLPVRMFETQLADGARIVRAMPNTPALVGKGITAICGGRNASPGDMQIAEDLLSAVGPVVRVQEAEMDAVTAISGSGPAYVFYLMEAMMEAADRMGLSAEVARSLVLKTVEGAAALAVASPDHPSVLRQRVTSKGGTTAAALSVMDEEEIHDHLITAMLSAQSRAHEMSEEFA